MMRTTLALLLVAPLLALAQDTPAPLDEWVSSRFDQHMNREVSHGAGTWVLQADALLLAARLGDPNTFLRSYSNVNYTPGSYYGTTVSINDTGKPRRAAASSFTVAPFAALGYQFASGDEWWSDYRFVDVAGGGAKLNFHTFATGWQPCYRDGRATLGSFVGWRGQVGGQSVPEAILQGSTTYQPPPISRQVTPVLYTDFNGNPVYGTPYAVTDPQPPITTSDSWVRSSRIRYWGTGPETGLDARLHFDETGLTLFGRGRVAGLVGTASYAATFRGTGQTYVSTENKAIGLIPWFADAGVSWRPPVCPELELRAGYHVESLNDGRAVLLFAQGAFAGLGWSF